ncbi:hypothetical protein F2P79_009025 [Pimephales promelas]|nr:hypothetical protein F2P79_009025 [Pimephales promelas]
MAAGMMGRRRRDCRDVTGFLVQHKTCFDTTVNPRNVYRVCFDHQVTALTSTPHGADRAMTPARPVGRVECCVGEK